MKKRAKLILLTHGNWGKELLTAAEMIVGEIVSCQALELMPEHAVADYRARLEKEMEGGAEILILADIKGGTPANIGSVYAKTNKRIQALCGLSLEMLLAADRLRMEYSGEELVTVILQEIKGKLVNLKE